MNKKLPWDIIISKLRGNLSDEGTISFNNWLKLEDNRELFQQLQTVWDNIQNKVASYEPDMEYYWKELSARMDNAETAPLRTKTKHFIFKPFYRYVAAASILLVITFSAAYFLGINRSLKPTISESYSSLTGKSKVILPDGSEVWLHSNTTLTYTNNSASNLREMSLSGEAYFNVTHDANKPFIVKVGHVAVKVHGTKFNVNAYNTANSVLVSLHEGSVEMKTDGKDVFLKPGEEGRFNKTNKQLAVNKGDVEFAQSWTSDQLQFEKKNLREVCKYLSKWYSVDINIDPAIADNQAYSFTVRNESLEEIARLLSRVNGINYQFTDKNELILSARK
ncbi:MAG: FecR domain-containing protein [Paludibacter sp.]|nr:FecR domain-containing protein [Paludibacter sp.]